MAEDMHEKLAIVIEACGVFVEGAQKSPDLLLVGSRYRGLRRFDLSESVTERLKDHLVVKVAIVKSIPFFELDHEAR